MTMREKETQLRLLRSKLLELDLEKKDEQVAQAHKCCKVILEHCGIQHMTVPLWTMAIACEGYFCEQKKPRAPLREIDPEQLPAPRAWRCLWWLDLERKRELGRLVYEGMTVAHEVIRQSKESDAAARQLATDILYALDAVGVLVSEVYKLEASIGLIGPM